MTLMPNETPQDTLTADATPTRHDPLDAWQWLMLVGLWCISHRYEGLIHDARLYAVQALRVLRPADFVDDLFFAHGSQDAFTLFPRVQAVFVDAIGLPGTSFLLTLAGHILWITGAHALFSRLKLCHGSLFWGLASLAALPPDFGAEAIFGYGEGFLTARIFVEALTFWALAFVGPKPVLSALIVGVALVLHPIYGLIAAATIFAILLGNDLRWAFFIPIGALAGLILAGLEVGPFAALLQTMDPEWRRIIDESNSIYLPLSWSTVAYCGVIVDVVVLGLCLLRASQAQRRLYVSILLVAIGGLGASVAADLSSNLLLIQLQLSRALWLLAAAANFGLGTIVYELASRRSGRPALAILGVGSCIQAEPYLSLGLVAVGAYAAAPILRSGATETPRWAALAAGAVGVLGLPLFAFSAFLHVRTLWAASALDLGSLLMVLTTPFRFDWALVFLGLFVAPWAAEAGVRTPRPLALAVMAVGVISWLARPTFDRDLESGVSLEAMREAIPSDALVYWHATGEVAGKASQLIWFGLDRRPYLTGPQSAGLIFNRETALDFERRVENLATLDADVYRNIPNRTILALRALPAPPLDDVQTACGSSPDLDFIVLGTPIDAPAVAVWTPRAPSWSTEIYRRDTPVPAQSRSFYLYRCEELRRTSLPAFQPSSIDSSR